MSRFQLRADEESFSETLRKVAEEARAITAAIVAQSNKEPTTPDEIYAVTEAIFRTHHRLPLTPYVSLVANGYIHDDLTTLAQSGFTNDALQALQPALFNAYAVGTLLGWLMRERYPDAAPPGPPPAAPGPDGT